MVDNNNKKKMKKNKRKPDDKSKNNDKSQIIMKPKTQQKQLPPPAPITTDGCCSATEELLDMVGDVILNTDEDDIDYTDIDMNDIDGLFLTTDDNETTANNTNNIGGGGGGGDNSSIHDNTSDNDSTTSSSSESSSSSSSPYGDIEDISTITTAISEIPQQQQITGTNNNNNVKKQPFKIRRLIFPGSKQHKEKMMMSMSDDNQQNMVGGESNNNNVVDTINICNSQTQDGNIEIEQRREELDDNNDEELDQLFKSFRHFLSVTGIVDGSLTQQEQGNNNNNNNKKFHNNNNKNKNKKGDDDIVNHVITATNTMIQKELYLHDRIDQPMVLFTFEDGTSNNRNKRRTLMRKNNNRKNDKKKALIKDTIQYTPLRLQIEYENNDKNSNNNDNDIITNIMTNNKRMCFNRPYQLIELERGNAAILCEPPPDESLLLQQQHNNDNKNKKKKKKQKNTSGVGGGGGSSSSSSIAGGGVLVSNFWQRGLLKLLLLLTLDDVNRIRLIRYLQISLPYLPSYEAYLLSQVIQSLDDNNNNNNNNSENDNNGDNNNIGKILRNIVFRNPTIYRLIIQGIQHCKYDFLYHWYTAIKWNIQFDIFARLFPAGSITRFPATENFPYIPNYALASIFRIILGRGNWITRILTGGHPGMDGIVTDNFNSTAKNVSAEINGYEYANRNQYGTYYGRKKTNQFRIDNRLCTDVDIIHTFKTHPISTMTNNGVVHTLRQLTKHWNKLLKQEYGHYTHHRYEQLNPFEAIRIHIPEVLLTLSSLRGRNVWDSNVLYPIIQKLQNLQHDTAADNARKLIKEIFQQDIIYNVSGGIASIFEPFIEWLHTISKALDVIEDEARTVYELITPVELGIRVGYDIMEQIQWKVPSDTVLIKAIINHIRGKKKMDPLTVKVRPTYISNALERLTPRDKRTLIELIQKDMLYLRPAKLLLSRVKTLLQREIRRGLLNEVLLALSKGDRIKHIEDVEVDGWYWLEDNTTRGCELFIYKGVSSDRLKHRFHHVNTGYIKEIVRVGAKQHVVRTRAYIPLAESITRAQKVFMIIELVHGKKFAYNAFMEFTPLRTALQRLAVVSQMTCDVLDNARLNILEELQHCNKKSLNAKCDPQNLIILGGGPTGMIACLHCTENVLASGGTVKLYEARESFTRGGATYEKAQIVQLDARWISMMRYHLGTAFEDTFIPASGEINTQLGNCLPSKGMVKVTIKDLESLLHNEISRLSSRGVISVVTDPYVHYDPKTNSLMKHGENLQIDDEILVNLNNEGDVSVNQYRWKVVELIHTKSLGIKDLKVGAKYGVYYKKDQMVHPFKLIEVDREAKTYRFQPKTSGVDEILVKGVDLPLIYPLGTDMKPSHDIHKVVLESLEEKSARAELKLSTLKKKKFTLDVGKCHVLEAIGKPSSTEFLHATNPQPYGFCCLEGLKVSMIMHNLGTREQGTGIIRTMWSVYDQSDQILGDYTKMIHVSAISKRMHHIMKTETNWILYFQKLVAESGFPDIATIGPVAAKIMGSCEWFSNNTGRIRQATLQTRVFEVGDNLYLGTELPCEYIQWRKDIVDRILEVLIMEKDPGEEEKLKKSLSHGLDCLWFFSCLEVLRTGDIYGYGTNHLIPRFHLIDSQLPIALSAIDVGESFRLDIYPEEKFEILGFHSSNIVARNVEGHVSHSRRDLSALRQSNLTRSPDGNSESKDALSTFLVSHFISRRSIRLSKQKEFVFAFLGDEQATQHFIQPSSLIGACIKVMSFNEFLENALNGVQFVNRYCCYSKESFWADGEAVQRGAGGNYREDNFLSLGFSYSDCMDYLFAKVAERKEGGQDTSCLLSSDWKLRFAATLIPFGMEFNNNFKSILLMRWHNALFDKLIQEIRDDKRFYGSQIEEHLQTRKACLDLGDIFFDKHWDDLIQGLRIETPFRKILKNEYLQTVNAVSRVCIDIIDFGGKASLYNKRISSESLNQPSSVDSVIDNLAVEAQIFAKMLTLSAALGAATFTYLGTTRFLSPIFCGLNMLIAFYTMTNARRYKVRNEEARILLKDKRLSEIKKAIFSSIDPLARRSLPEELNPFVCLLDRAAKDFRNCAIYYDYEKPNDFDERYKEVKKKLHDIEALRSFQEFLIERLITDTYHVNSYVQDALVQVYRVLDEIIHSVSLPTKDGLAQKNAKRLLFRLNRFENNVEKSLQREPTHLGFIKIRKWYHSDLMVTFRYFYSLIWFFPWDGWCCSPIETETYWMFKKILRYSKKSQQSGHLKRAVRDSECLYIATRESDFASLIFVASGLTLLTSLVFIVATTLFFPEYLKHLAFYAATASMLGAILAAFFLFQNFIILLRISRVLSTKRQKIDNESHTRAFERVRQVTHTQLFLTIARIFAVCATALVLTFAVVEMGYSDFIAISPEISFWLALGAVVTAVGSFAISFCVEYAVCYKLNTYLGPFVCSIFETEIENLYKNFSVQATNTVDLLYVRDRETWEYTARAFLHQHRFDIILDADRFGQIFQHILSEMKSLTPV